MKLSFTYSPLWIIPIVLLAAALTYFMYRRTRTHLPLIPQAIVSLFRFTVLTALGILLLEPLLNSLTKLRFPPIIVVLQDGSESMVLHKQADFVKNKYPAQLKAFLAAFPENDYIIEGYRFDNQLRTGLNPDSLRYKGAGTNIASPLKEIQSLYQNQNLGAVVVLSDGITTSGMNPVYALEGMKQPVYTVLVGDTTLQKDIKIKDAVYNELAYLNTDVPIKVKVVNDGFETAALKVTIAQGDKVVATKPLNLSKTNPQGEVDFLIRPTQVGLQSFTVSVTQLEGEITYKNNVRTFAINILESRVKVAIFGGSPHPDLGALNQAMAHEEGYQVSEFILKGKGDFYTTPAGANLKDFDFFILHNFPNSPADAPIVAKILEEVRDRKVPVMYYIGMFTDLQTMRPLFEYMALSPENINPRSEEAVATFTENYKKHTTYNYGENWLKMMSNAPPIYRNKSEWKAKTTAEIFATAKIKNIPMNNYPVFALQSHLERKNMVFVGENFWRMRAQVYTETESFDNFDDWYFNMVKWLMVRDDKRKFRAYATKNAYMGDEPAILKGEAYDDSYNPMSGVEIKVAMRFPNGKINDYYLTETGNRQYYLDIYSLPEGTYTFNATGKKDGKVLGEDKGQFSVGRSDIEHINLRADKATMEQMALRTGGKALHYTEMSQLADLIKQNQNLKPVVDFKKNKKPLLDWWWVLAGILGLLAVEWVIRKWYSML